MPRPLKPPSRIDPLTLPAFGMSWYANPGDGTSVLAYCGGGGSAKTGVNNFIRVQAPPNSTEGDDENEEGSVLKIDTGEQVGIALKIVQNPMTGKIWLLVALGSSIQRYSLPSGEKAGEIHVKDSDGVNCVNCNIMCDRLAVGCENGSVRIYEISDDKFDGLVAPRLICNGHTKTVCAVVFSNRGGRIVSSAKDGTARVWDGDGHCLAELACSVEGGKNQGGKKGVAPKRPMQVLVRGCAVGDLDGKVIYTVASARRGSAFLSRWIESPEEPGKFACERIACSEHPISAMSLSDDGELLALGSVDGSIILWSRQDWAPIRVFPEVHDLPVTCIAARPFAGPLRGEDDGVPMHAISASADSRLAHLTLIKRAPKKSGGGGGGEGSTITTLWNLMIWLVVAYAALNPVIWETRARCTTYWQDRNFPGLQQCILHEVLIAPATDPGIKVPPH